MNFGWLTAWWDALARRPPADPWNDDPEIQRERKRQHDEGITDAATRYHLRRQLRERRVDVQMEAWRRRRQRDDANG